MTERQGRRLILFMILLLVSCADPTTENPSISLPPGQWIKVTRDSSPTARILHAMAYDEMNQQVILFGGKDSTGVRDDTWVYQSVDDSWIQKSIEEAPPPREGHAMVYDRLNNRVILFGGKGAFGLLLNDTWTYNAADNEWTRLLSDPSPSERWLTAMVYDPDHQQAVLFGGETNAGLNNETWILDLQNDNWMNRTPSTPPSPRFGHAMSYDVNSENVILYGGETSLTSRLRDDETWVYNVPNNSWIQMNSANPPLPRSKHAMVYSATQGQVLMYGGFADGSSLPSGETWVYDYPTNRWTELFPDQHPARSFLHAMVYDTDTGETILFGGASMGCGTDPACEADTDSFLKDTWRYVPD